MITPEPNGRGFLSFGRYVRESSAALIPKAWVTIDGDEEHLAIDELRQYISGQGVPTRLVLEAEAFIAFAETTAYPRWLDWDQPA
ncbi:unnamed protein product, partial [marine sediment metagenome]